MPTQAPPSANRYQAVSALAASQAGVQAAKVAGAPAEVAAAITRFQIAGATLAARAVDRMLADQGFEPERLADINPPAFTTPADHITAMLGVIEDDIEARIERMAESVVQEAQRAAQQAAVAARVNVQWVRHLNLPSCSRCAVLAGRIYRFSEGFRRHPGCDCIMLPVTVASPDYVVDPVELAEAGQVTGLSKADRRAIQEGADFNRLVNVRARSAGLTESGQVLDRAGRLSPSGIYRMAGDDRELAVQLLKRHGYLI